MVTRLRRKATFQDWPWKAIATVLILSPLVGSCGLFSDDSAEGPPGTEESVPADDSFVGDTQTIITDPSDRFQVTLPATWQEDNQLHPSADIEASRRAADLYLIVLAESKTEIGNSFALDEVSTLYRGSFVDGLGNVDQVALDTPAVGGGYNAVQYRIDATLDGTEIIALHTTIETGEYYYQIVAWTKATFYTSYAEELQVVINGFRELGSG